jgi:regulator of replication initiation timing
MPTTVQEDLRALGVQSEVERMRDKLANLCSVFEPRFAELLEEMQRLRPKLREYIEPAMATENARLHEENDKLRALAQQCVLDLKHVVATHASDYAARRAKELTDALAKL